MSGNNNDNNTNNQQHTETKFTETLTLEEIRSRASQFAKERNWTQYHTPRNLLLAMVGEVGELSEIFQWRGEVQAGLPDWTAKDKEHLGEELSDVLIYLTRLADICGVDLAAACLDKFKKNAQKYPADKAYGSSAKYTAYQQQHEQETNTASTTTTASGSSGQGHANPYNNNNNLE